MSQVQGPGLEVDAFAMQLLQSVELGPSQFYQLGCHKPQFNASLVSVS